jgi:hypothetical protein
VSDETVHVALPLARVSASHPVTAVPFSFTVTLPLAVPAVPETAMVSRTASPLFDGLGVALNVMVGTPWIACAIAPEVTGWYAVSPA